MQSLTFAFALVLPILRIVHAIPHDQITVAPQYGIDNGKGRSSNGDQEPELVKRVGSIGINTCGWVDGNPRKHHGWFLFFFHSRIGSTLKVT
jgi:hypothetical protein